MKQGLFIPRFKTTRLHNSFKYQEVKISNYVPQKYFRLIDLKLKKKTSLCYKRCLVKIINVRQTNLLSNKIEGYLIQ